MKALIQTQAFAAVRQGAFKKESSLRTDISIEKGAILRDIDVTGIISDKIVRVENQDI